MITTPADPVQTLIDAFNIIRRRIALYVCDESEIITDGMNMPDTIVTTSLDFERQNEEVINRRVEQYRSPLLLACEVTTLYLLKKHKRSLRAHL